MVGDVLEEAPFGLDLTQDAGDVGPEVPGVIHALPPSGNAERLARIAAQDAIHNAAPGAAVEGGKIAPHRRRIQGFIRHARQQDADRVGFPLNITDCSSSGNRQSEAEIESSDAAAEGEGGKGKNHI